VVLDVSACDEVSFVCEEEGKTISQFTKAGIILGAILILFEWYFTSPKFFQTHFLPVAFVMFLIGAWADKNAWEKGWYSKTDSKLGGIIFAIPLAWMTSYIW